MVRAAPLVRRAGGGGRRRLLRGVVRERACSVGEVDRDGRQVVQVDPGRDQLDREVPRRHSACAAADVRGLGRPGSPAVIAAVEPDQGPGRDGVQVRAVVRAAGGEVDARGAGRLAHRELARGGPRRGELLELPGKSLADGIVARPAVAVAEPDLDAVLAAGERRAEGPVQRLDVETPGQDSCFAQAYAMEPVSDNPVAPADGLLARLERERRPVGDALEVDRVRAAADVQPQLAVGRVEEDGELVPIGDVGGHAVAGEGRAHRILAPFPVPARDHGRRPGVVQGVSLRGRAEDPALRLPQHRRGGSQPRGRAAPRQAVPGCRLAVAPRIERQLVAGNGRHGGGGHRVDVLQAQPGRAGQVAALGPAGGAVAVVDELVVLAADRVDGDVAHLRREAVGRGHGIAVGVDVGVLVDRRALRAGQVAALGPAGDAARVLGLLVPSPVGPDDDVADGPDRRRRRGVRRPVQDRGAARAGRAGQVAAQGPAGGAVAVVDELVVPAADGVDGDVAHLRREAVGRGHGIAVGVDVGVVVDRRAVGAAEVDGALLPGPGDLFPQRAVGLHVQVAVLAVVGVVGIVLSGEDLHALVGQQGGRHRDRAGDRAEVAGLVLGAHPDLVLGAGLVAAALEAVGRQRGRQGGVREGRRGAHVHAGQPEVGVVGIGPAGADPARRRDGREAADRARRGQVAGHRVLDDRRPVARHELAAAVPRADLVRLAGGDAGVGVAIGAGHAGLPLRGTRGPHFHLGRGRGRRGPGDHQPHDGGAVGGRLGHLVDCQALDAGHRAGIRQADRPGL